MVPNAQNGASSPASKRRKISTKPPAVAEMLESIVGCKWSMRVLDAIVGNLHRPGDLQRACAGISQKVLNERLRKLCRFGILRRVAFPEVPPRVEYRLTDFGKRFIPLVTAVGDLQKELESVVATGRKPQA